MRETIDKKVIMWYSNDVDRSDAVYFLRGERK
jgi:hypothetical protein